MDHAPPPTLRGLPVACPPMLAEAIGYDGPCRFVAFAWSPAGDEAVYDDGYRSGTGTWRGYLAFVRHRLIRPLLADAHLGSSDQDASHWLLADRREQRLYLGLRSEVRTFLRAANRPTVLPSGAADVAPIGSVDDLIEELRTGVFADRFEEVTPDAEELQARVAAWQERQDHLVASLIAWLDRQAGPDRGSP